MLFAHVVRSVGRYESSEGRCCCCSPSGEQRLAFLSVGGVRAPSLILSETEAAPFLTRDSVLSLHVFQLVYSSLHRESRRKTPVAVSLKENERLFGDSALGMVGVAVTYCASCSSSMQSVCSPCWVRCDKSLN